MKGDFTRDTFDPAKHYSRVLMQQGRVQLDADWNEQASILLNYMRMLTQDLFGPHAGPDGECGFEITVSGDDLSISEGRYYVRGIPVECADGAFYSKQLSYRFDDAEKKKIAGLEKMTWLAYLDVWEAFVSYVQDDHIRESALGGPDSCGRAKIMWQVRIMWPPEKGGAFDCNSATALPSTGNGRLKARARNNGKADELCAIAPDSKYRGAENQLYRVEVHKGADAKSSAAFKWSRDNGSVIFPIRSLAGNAAELEHLGRDSSSTLNEGDWVEVVDDALLARDGVGLLCRVVEVKRDDLVVTLALAKGQTDMPVYPRADADVHPLLRRWDHTGDLENSGGAIAIVESESKWTTLEDGVEIQFEKGGDYHAGDYWMIPARVATGDVEWPGEPGDPDFKMPGGPHHYYAPLMYFDVGKVADCRCRIARLPCKKA
jgi:hypothetical protein